MKQTRETRDRLWRALLERSAAPERLLDDESRRVMLAVLIAAAITVLYLLVNF